LRGNKGDWVIDLKLVATFECQRRPEVQQRGYATVHAEQLYGLKSQSMDRLR
jgi:hypothetical protein